MNAQEQKQLMEQALRETVQYGRELTEICSQVRDHLQSGKQQRGIQLLRQLLEGLGYVSQALHLTQPLHAEKQLRIDLEKLAGLLEPVVAALENQDYSLISDILVHELRPQLTNWIDQIESAA